MLVTVQKDDKTCSTIVVRYSPQIGGLFSCTGIMSGEMVRDIPKMLCASAPFTVYAGDWNDYGFDEDETFFESNNVVAKIPYAERQWNFM